MEDEIKKEETVEKKEVAKVEATPEKKAEEPKKEEGKKVESEEVKVDVEALRNELEEANKKAIEVDTLTATVVTMQKDSETKDATIKEYEELVGKLIETKMEHVPAEFKELIPDNLNLKQKLSWLEKAEAKGLFNKEEKKKPSVEIGKPMNIDAPTVDTSKLTAGQLLKMAYSTVKK